MAEKEYIERNDLINNRPPQRNPDQTGKEEYNKGYNDGVKAFLNCVKEQPADNNVVEVVRCKDCEYASYWYGNDNLKNTKYLCFFAEDEGVKTFADDFCSRGKRRE